MNFETDGCDLHALAQLSDARVLEGFGSLVRSGRRVTAALVAHLAEVEERRLHLKAGYGSLFTYCVTAHGMSEDEACRRIEVARLGRRFPDIFCLLASGELSLTVTAELKHHLRVDNASELLHAVSGKSVREARRELAARFPQTDAPTLIRKLPEPRVDGVTFVSKSAEAALDPVASTSAAALTAASTGAAASTAQTGCTPAAASPTVPSYRERSRIDPTARERYRVQFSASGELKRKLDRARDLMAHRNPSCDLARVIEPALDLLIAMLRKQRCGETRAPVRKRRSAAAGRLTAATKREVSARDGARCTYVDAHGRRCESRAFLEFDHRIPVGMGGSSRPDNMRLLCRAHNLLAAEAEYGREKIESEISERRRQREERSKLLVRDCRRAPNWVAKQLAANAGQREPRETV